MTLTGFIPRMVTLIQQALPDIEHVIEASAGVDLPPGQQVVTYFVQWNQRGETSSAPIQEWSVQLTAWAPDIKQAAESADKIVEVFQRTSGPFARSNVESVAQAVSTESIQLAGFVITVRIIT